VACEQHFVPSKFALRLHLVGKLISGFVTRGDIQSWNTGKESDMLWTVFVILLILWGLGLITSYTMGGFIHILLVIAIVVVLVQVIQGRRRS
jgi:hypothetical protein